MNERGIKKIFERCGFFYFTLIVMNMFIFFLVEEGVVSSQVFLVSENILKFITKLIILICIIIMLFILIFLFGSIMCDVGVMIKQSWLCMTFVERAITKRSLKRLKKSNLVLFLLGEYLSDYKFDTRDELDREVKKYKYLISNGIRNAIVEIVASKILFLGYDKEERIILKQVLKENKEKLDRVDFEKVKRVIRKIDYRDPLWKHKEKYTTTSGDYKYNDENYYEYFSKSPVLPESAIFDDFEFIKCRELNEMIEVVDNPEEEFPLYIDPTELMRLHYKKYETNQ